MCIIILFFNDVYIVHISEINFVLFYIVRVFLFCSIFSVYFCFVLYFPRISVLFYIFRVFLFCSMFCVYFCYDVCFPCISVVFYVFRVFLFCSMFSVYFCYDVCFQCISVIMYVSVLSTSLFQKGIGASSNNQNCPYHSRTKINQYNPNSSKFELKWFKGGN